MEETLEEMDKKPEFLCLTEHWYAANEINSMHIDGYTNISKYARTKTIHGGSALLAENSLDDVEEVKEIIEMSVEGEIECSSLVCRSLKIVIVCIYRPPNGSEGVFIEILSDILNKLCNLFRKNYKHIVCGDFNINLLKDSSHAKSFRDLMYSFDMKQTISEPTRITENSATLVDNIFINFENDIQGQVISNSLSDHEAQILDVSVPCVPENDAVFVVKRIFSQAKMQQFRQELMGCNWCDVYSSADVDQAYNIFFNIFSTLFNLIFPLKKIKKSRKQKTKSWITSGIKKSSKTKRNLYKKVRLGKASKATYKTYSKLFKNVVIQAKKNFEHQYIKNSHCPAKAVWKLVKQYTGKSQKK